MHCVEAQRLLAAGVVPGGSGNRDPYLGFHLAGCPPCRGFRDELDTRVLSTLLGAEPEINAKTQRGRPLGQGLIDRQPLVVDHPVILSPGHLVTRSPRHVFAAAFVAVLLLVWWIGLPVLRAAHNLQAMYSPALPLAPLAATSLPALDEPAEQVAQREPPARAAAAKLVAATPAPPAPVFALAPAPTVGAGVLALPTATPTPVPTPPPTATPVLPPVAAKTILLLGLDARPGEGLNARSDALMLARVDPERGDIALLSLPRDLWAAIPGYGESKINAAFFFGEYRQPGNGLQLAKQTVGATLGIPIDYAVAIDFAGFRALVDAVGGISVDVPVELYDGTFPTDDYGYMVAHFLPGPQQMDGARALVYARTRHADSDFERMKRQQLVLLGILQRIRERGALANLHEADTLTAALRPFVHTDVPPAEALALLWQLREVDAARVRRMSVDAGMVYASSIAGSFALVAPDGVLANMGGKLLNDER